MRPSASPSPRALLALGFLIPPLAFFGWMFGSQSLGNDYPVYQVDAALSLRAYGALGLEPLWYPHLSGGFPVGGLVLGQYFHLPAWLQSLLPGYWTGGALVWFTVRHLALLALAHGLFFWAARRLVGLDRMAGYLVSFALVYNQRTLDALRYGPALDASVYGYGALLLAAAALVRPGPWILVALGALTQLALTAGYPVVLPFLLLGAGALALAAVRAGGEKWPEVLRRSGLVTVAVVAGALLAAPNLLAFAEYVPLNAKRVLAPSLAWASYLQMEPASLLANLVFPWSAEVHSSFGGSTLIAILLATLVLLILAHLRTAWPCLAFLGFPVAYALGRRSWVYLAFFRWAPGFASMRTPGRVIVLGPIAIVAVLLWLRSSVSGESVRRALRAAAFVNVALLLYALAAVALASGSAWAGDPPPAYSAAGLTSFWTTGARVVWLGLGLAAGGALLAAARRPTLGAGLLLACTVAQTGMVLRHGTWMAERKPTPALAAFERANELPFYGEPPLLADNTLLEGSIGLATVPYTRFRRQVDAAAMCTLPVDPNERHKGVLLPIYLSSHVACAFDERQALKLLAARPCRRNSRLETVLVGPSCTPRGPEPSNADLAGLNAGNVLAALGPNGFVLDVDATTEAVLVSPYPAVTRNWTGTMDGRALDLEVVDGAFWGLRVPSGHHRVALQYFSPRILLGYRIAFGTALALGLFGLIRLRPQAVPFLMVTLLVALPIGYFAWERSFRREAATTLLLANDYPRLLAAQLARWRE